MIWKQPWSNATTLPGCQWCRGSGGFRMLSGPYWVINQDRAAGTKELRVDLILAERSCCRLQLFVPERQCGQTFTSPGFFSRLTDRRHPNRLDDLYNIWVLLVRSRLCRGGSTGAWPPHPGWGRRHVCFCCLFLFRPARRYHKTSVILFSLLLCAHILWCFELWNKLKWSMRPIDCFTSLVTESQFSLLANCYDLPWGRSALVRGGPPQALFFFFFYF